MRWISARERSCRASNANIYAWAVHLLQAVYMGLTCLQSLGLAHTSCRA